MDPGYETVVDVTDLIWTLAVYVLHVVLVFFQVSLGCFLLGTGGHGLFCPRSDAPWLRRLGVTAIGGSRVRGLGALRIGLGLLLFAPLVLDAPMALSLLALLAAFSLLVMTERRLEAEDAPRGRLIRRASIGFAALAALFVAWEREDNLVLGADLLLRAQEWRTEELAWQLSMDPKSPKVGDLAPDFELQDPEGRVQVRLSDFRGKRPVALVFGSYT